LDDDEVTHLANSRDTRAALQRQRCAPSPLIRRARPDMTQMWAGLPQGGHAGSPASNGGRGIQRPRTGLELLSFYTDCRPPSRWFHRRNY
jgi:hypothetical protein